jgi:hypothetical protein
VGITVVRPGLEADDPFAVHPPHLQRVHGPALRVGRHGEDEDVTEVVGPVGDEEEALAPVVVVRLDVDQRFGELVDEELVHGGELHSVGT